MSLQLQHHPGSGHSSIPLWVTLVLSVPAVMTFVSALELRNGAWLVMPGLWFTYASWREVALIGIVLAVALDIDAVVRHLLTTTVMTLALCSIIGAAFLLWYSGQLTVLFP